MLDFRNYSVFMSKFSEEPPPHSWSSRMWPFTLCTLCTPPPPSKINHTQYDYSTADEIGMHLATNEYIGRCTFGKCTSLKIRWGAQEMTTCRLNCSLTHQYLHGGHVLNSYTQRNMYTQQMGIMCMHAEHTHTSEYTSAAMTPRTCSQCRWQHCTVTAPAASAETTTFMSTQHKCIMSLDFQCRCNFNKYKTYANTMWTHNVQGDHTLNHICTFDQNIRLHQQHIEKHYT